MEEDMSRQLAEEDQRCHPAQPALPWNRAESAAGTTVVVGRMAIVGK